MSKTIHISDDLHNKLKDVAESNGQNISKAAEIALENAVKEGSSAFLPK